MTGIEKFLFTLYTILVLGIVVGGLGAVAGMVIDGVSHMVVLMPCATEDSDQCYWDAQEQGNGQGRSFVVLDGTVYFE